VIPRVILESKGKVYQVSNRPGKNTGREDVKLGGRNLRSAQWAN